MRYVLEGEWSGYTSAQTRVVHREALAEKEYDKLCDLQSIIYTDGTSLNLFMRPAKPREQVAVRDQYGSLIREAARMGKPVVTVSELT